MKLIRVLFIASMVVAAGCLSWVFAKSPFNEMPEGQYKLDLSHASVVWKVSHFGLSDYVARFSDFDATIEFYPNDIESSKVSARIDPMSIQTAYPKPEETDFNQVLATDEEWFNAGKFTDIKFQSTNIEMTGDKTAVMKGELTLLGVSREVSLEVEFNGAMLRQPLSGKPTMGFSASTTIQRSQWGMDKFVPNIGDKVEVLIEAEFYAGE